MTEKVPQETNHSQAHFDEPELSMAQSTPLWALTLGIGTVILLIFGLVTWALGLGPFAYRQIFYGTSELYMLNMTDQHVEVTLDKGTAIPLKPEGVERTPILGGTTLLVTNDKDGKTLEQHEIFVDGNPIFYNVQGERCMVLSDVSSFYLNKADKGIKILKTFDKGQSIIPLPHDRIIWPRQTLRDQVKGAEHGVAWIELVACSLLDPDERHILESHLNIKLTERKKHQQALKKQQEIQRQMRQGGTEAVDKYIKNRDKKRERPPQQPTKMKIAPKAP